MHFDNSISPGDPRSMSAWRTGDFQIDEQSADSGKLARNGIPIGGTA